MRFPTSGGGLRSALLPSVVVVLLCGVLPAAAQSGSWPRVHIDDARTAGAVRLALDGAARRLTRDRCLTLFAEFHDQRGLPLSSKLAELGPSAREYLELVLFQDGSEAKRCTEHTLAFTGPGHRVVYICSQTFVRLRNENMPLAEVIVIHEMLHTLGLGENPPSTHAITRRVLSQCAG
jgi:hypothetical protein